MNTARYHIFIRTSFPEKWVLSLLRVGQLPRPNGSQIVMPGIGIIGRSAFLCDFP